MSDRYFETDDQLTNFELSDRLLGHAMSAVNDVILEHHDDSNGIDPCWVESLETSYQILKHARAAVRHEEMVWRLTHD